jgi:4-hydroxybutyryl-CoA dehydratase/vinylacetyl-CoA-Delta-isomerase
MHGAGSPRAQRVQIARLAKLEEKEGLAKKLAGVAENDESGRKTATL